MKKLLLLLAFLTGSVAAAHAIPRGAYVNKRGSVDYIVDQSGTEIYTIGRDGNVMITRVVVSEQEMDDGTIKVILQTSGMNVQTVVYYWEENGMVYLNDGLRTLHRE